MLSKDSGPAARQGHERERPLAGSAVARGASARRSSRSRRRRPGPGQVLAPICHSRSTGVACPGLLPERPPEEVLVERERAAVGIAVPEVDVRPLQVVRAERDPLQDRRLEVGDVAREPCLDPVRVALTQLVVHSPLPT